MDSYSIYLHIPFCIHRCGYCDFNTYAGLDDLIPAYLDALCTEIAWGARTAGTHLPVHTIFFGGGTPSLLDPAGVAMILETLANHYDIVSPSEITMEANPGTLSLAYLQEIHRLGVNRLSLGMQSASPSELRLLERMHSYEDVISSVNWARQAGFSNLNLDLIFGLPEQALESWQHSLRLALELHPEHFSLYALTIEHGTPFGQWAERGLISMPDPDMAAEMYEWASEQMGNNGYAQYEISNWGKLPCTHNLQYWRNLPYLGFGAGAHGYAGGKRTANVLSPASYIHRMRNLTEHALNNPENSPKFPATPATQDLQPIDRSTEMGETMMVGLRLVQEGVSAQAFAQRFGQDLHQVYGKEIERLVSLGLLEWSGDEKDILRLTSRGRLLGNQVFMQFI